MSSTPRRIDDLGLILELAPVIAWATTPDGELAFLNRFGRDYFGPEPENADPIWLLSHVAASDRARAADQWSDRWRAAERWTSELRMRNQAGDQRRMIVNARAARPTSGQLFGWVGTCVDVEDERIAADSLRHNAVEIGLLLADANDAARRERHRLESAANESVIGPLESATRDLAASLASLRSMLATP
jgi:hypothetical protein